MSPLIRFMHSFSSFSPLANETSLFQLGTCGTPKSSAIVPCNNEYQTCGVDMD